MSANYYLIIYALTKYVSRSHFPPGRRTREPRMGRAFCDSGSALRSISRRRPLQTPWRQRFGPSCCSDFEFLSPITYGQSHSEHTSGTQAVLRRKSHCAAVRAQKAHTNETALIAALNTTSVPNTHRSRTSFAFVASSFGLARRSMTTRPWSLLRASGRCCGQGAKDAAGAGVC